VFALNDHPLLPDRSILDLTDEALNNATMKAKGAASKPAAKEPPPLTRLQAQGLRVKKLRLDKGWNRTLLARKAGVTISTVRTCEEGSKNTQPEKLKAIASALGVSAKRLEADDSKDPRVKGWHDEDYEIGAWFHHAPRALKNRIWQLHEITTAGAALTDAQFIVLLEAWPTLEQDQKNYILSNYRFIITNPHPGALPPDDQ